MNVWNVPPNAERAWVKYRAFIFYFVSFLFIASAVFTLIFPDRMRFGGWLMFSGYAADVCKVNYKGSIDSKFQNLDRFQLLGYENPFESPNQIRIIQTLSQAVEIGQKLCAADKKLNSVVTDVSCPEGPKWRKMISHHHKCES